MGIGCFLGFQSKQWMWGDVLHAVANSGRKGKYFLCFQWVSCIEIRFRMSRVFVFYFFGEGIWVTNASVSRHCSTFTGPFRVMMAFGSGDVRNRCEWSLLASGNADKVGINNTLFFDHNLIPNVRISDTKHPDSFIKCRFNFGVMN